jgi:hypothetical protein
LILIFFLLFFVLSCFVLQGVQLEPYGVEVVAQSDTKSGSSFTTGGGFSVYYPVPAWQTSSISAYFTSAAAAGHTPMTGHGTGRGFPDISVAGVNYVVIIGGKSTTESGTSASAPVVAAFFSNINAARMAIGKGSLGWVNPALYEYGNSFINDITSGNNKCVALGTCCPQGYYAGPGWDPACGLGSPNYGKMHHKLVALGSEINGALPTSLPTVRGTGPSSKPSLKPTSRPSISVNPTYAPVIPPTKTPIQPPTQSPSQGLIDLTSGKLRLFKKNQHVFFAYYFYLN